MKTTLKYIVTVMVLAGVMAMMLMVSGCQDDKKTDADPIKTFLIGDEWKISSVKVDGTDQTAMFTGMTLSFTVNAYTTTKGGIVWPASGTWTRATSDGNVIQRDDGVAVSIPVIGTNTLVLELDWSKTTYGGRGNSVSGHHVFTFIR
jgi:hypothetical protein